jgi:hypothetical protein
MARDEFIFTKASELMEFISKKQPDDETRHQLVLPQILSLKKWTEADLSDEFNLKLGLHLL